MGAPYSRETTDALLAGLRHEWRADLKQVEGTLKTEIKQVEGALRTEVVGAEGRVTARIDGLRGELKTWFLVMGAILAVIASGVGNRILGVLWPAGPASPPGVAAVPFSR